MGRKKKEIIEEILDDEDEELLDDSPVIVSDDIETVESLDTIKKRFEKKGIKEGSINQEDIFDAVSHLDLDDEELDKLIQYFKDKKIEVISDTDDTDLDDIDISEDDLEKMSSDDGLSQVFDDADYDDNAMEHIDPNIDMDLDLLTMDAVKINDPVKMYLKQIGCYRLLSSQ